MVNGKKDFEAIVISGGRIVIPKILRTKLEIEQGDLVYVAEIRVVKKARQTTEDARQRVPEETPEETQGAPSGVDLDAALDEEARTPGPTALREGMILERIPARSGR